MAAQNEAAALFKEVVDAGMIRAGKLESELTEEIYALAKSRYGVRRRWRKRIARAGPTRRYWRFTLSTATSKLAASSKNY
jgi:hypothetical protein